MTKLKITPKIMGNICMTAHPLGCKKLVEEQINYVKNKNPSPQVSSSGEPAGPKNVLVIGGSGGYGLATRIVSAYVYGAKTLNVAFENPARPEKKRPASVGWYNTVAFEKIVQADGLWAQSIFGDAFSKEIKEQTITHIKEHMGTVDMVVYSIAAGKRSVDGTMYCSVLKPLGKDFSEKTLNVITGKTSIASISAANEEEKNNTVKVMGGEDWQLWIKALSDAKVLAKNSITLAYSYIGPTLTQDLYRNGTIGKAKEHLETTAHVIDEDLQSRGLGRAYVSVNKALVTRASMVIPVVPLYISILYKIMKEKNVHEGCIEQMYRMLKEKIYNQNSINTDADRRIRLDDLEMRDDIQLAVKQAWQVINDNNLDQYADVKGFQEDFYHLHGFNWLGIDYDQEVEV